MMVSMVLAAGIAHLTFRLDRPLPGCSLVTPPAAVSPARPGITPEPVDG